MRRENRPFLRLLDVSARYPRTNGRYRVAGFPWWKTSKQSSGAIRPSSNGTSAWTARRCSQKPTRYLQSWTSLSQLKTDNRVIFAYDLAWPDEPARHACTYSPRIVTAGTGGARPAAFPIRKAGLCSITGTKSVERCVPESHEGAVCKAESLKHIEAPAIGWIYLGLCMALGLAGTVSRTARAGFFIYGRLGSGGPRAHPMRCIRWPGHSIPGCG